jgi:glutamine synthetase
VRETLTNYYRRKGLRAVFIPIASKEGGGNGCHVHLSLWKDGKNVLGDMNKKYGLSDAGQNFIAGILHHYKALVHFLAPNTNSRRRITPKYFVGAYKFWGVENKEAPIRLCESVH